MSLRDDEIAERALEARRAESLVSMRARYREMGWSEEPYLLPHNGFVTQPIVYSDEDE